MPTARSRPGGSSSTTRAHAPRLDALGGRARIEAGVRRLERAPLLDCMTARFATGWEALQDRVRETGRHRFFLPEHERLCDRMSNWETTFVRDSGARQFMRNELDLRREMTGQAERLDRVARELRESVDRRGQAERSGAPFVRQEAYRDWVYPARQAVREAKEILGDRKYEVHFGDRPGLKDTLRDLSGGIDRQLVAERAQWEDMQKQRIQAEQRQSRGQGRGMSF